MPKRSALRATLVAGTALLLATGGTAPAFAQTAPPVAAKAAAASGAPETKLAQEAARELVASVALYPDPILAAVLEAATTPLDVVEAERFLAKREKDPTLQPDPDWSPAIVALLNHPDLLRRMSEDLDWTRALGAAVVEDLPVVQLAIQVLRRGALALGMLADTEFQRIVREEDLIAIEPVDPDSVRLPVYDPDRLLAALAVPPAPPTEPAPGQTTAASEPEPPLPRPRPDAAATAAQAAAAGTTAFSPTAPVLSASEPYPARPAAPPPEVAYAAPERGFWSDAAIFAGGAALGGVLGYLIADRDDDKKKVVKNYYYFGDRGRPPGWWRDRIDWREEGWRPDGRIVRADKIVIKDSNVVITGDDLVVRRLRERRGELARIARPGESPPESWHDWERERRRKRAERLLLEREPRRDDRPAIAVLPGREGARSDRRGEVRPAIAVLPSPDRVRAEERARRREEARRFDGSGATLSGPSSEERGAARGAREEERRLERQRAREEKAAAERALREQRQQEKFRLQEERRARAELQAREERRRGLEQQRLERARAAELARAQEAQRRQAAEQAKLSRRQQEEAQRLERQQRRAERAELRRGQGGGQGGKKKRWQEG